MAPLLGCLALLAFIPGVKPLTLGEHLCQDYKTKSAFQAVSEWEAMGARKKAFLSALVVWEDVCGRKLPRYFFPSGRPEYVFSCNTVSRNCPVDPNDPTEPPPTTRVITTTTATDPQTSTLASSTVEPTSRFSSLELHQCLECTFGFCESLADNGACDKCACHIGRTGKCCEEVSKDLCVKEEMNPCFNDTAEMHRTCQKRISGLTRCDCDSGWEGSKCTTVHDPCQCKNGGTCGVDKDGKAKCECPDEFEGTHCEMRRPCYPDCFPCSIKAHHCRNNASCWPTLNAVYVDEYQCICAPGSGYRGTFCDEEIPCAFTNPCQHDGECYEENGVAKCDCLSIWKGDYCETFNICHDDKCMHGICRAVSEMEYACDCFPGYTGRNCETMIDLCKPNPCLYNSACVPLINSFECICAPGLEGRHCEENFDDCVTPTGLNPCQRKDNEAECVDEVNAFRCNCSAGWTGDKCSMRVLIYNVLKHFDSYDDSLVDMLEDLLERPELIKDTVPFLLAQNRNKSHLSWDHEDLFDWATIQGVELDVDKEIVKWNSPSFGNCFTFNHDSLPLRRSLSYSGSQEGFQALMRVRQDEYLDWVDTSSLLVFVHSSNEPISGESPRHQATPGTETTLSISHVSFERLGGVFGECVKNKSDARSYYYDGDYTIEGCIRSCYQNAVVSSCGCSDPRYPYKNGTSICDLSRHSCVREVIDHKGEPISWPQCHCPMPCTSSQYIVASSSSKLHMVNNIQTSPITKDHVLITVHFTHLVHNTFVEIPKTDFSKVLSTIGGLLGLLGGVSVMAMLEMCVYIVKLVIAWKSVI